MRLRGPLCLTVLFGLFACTQRSDSSPASSSDAVIEAALRACSDRDGEALWALLGDSFRSEIQEMAERMAGALSVEDLKRAYGYTEPVDTLDGPTFLDMSLSAESEHDNPCWKASEWQKHGEDRSEDRHSVVFELPNGRARGVLAIRSNDEWRIGKITQSIALPMPSAP